MHVTVAAVPLHSCLSCSSIQVNSNYNVEYRDGIKSRGDKIGMPCTHTTVI